MLTFAQSLLRAVAVASIVVGMSACAPLVTQNPGQGWSPVNAKDINGAERVLLDGHDVVAYFTESRHRLGDPKFVSTYKGVRLQFATPENKARFEANPEAYLPQYGGYCANGIVYGIPWGGDADSWRIVNGRLYIFGGSLSRKGFDLDVQGNIAMADKYWKEEVNGSNAFIQRNKRLIMRVPHYKSGSDLAAMVAAAEKQPK